MNDDSTIREAKAFLRLHARNRGASCPCCGQFVKVYRRNVTYAMSKSLILIAQNTKPDEYIHVQNLLTEHKHANSDWAKFAHWKLIEPQAGIRADGSSRDGYWRLTAKGRQFVGNALAIPASATMYNGKAHEFSDKLVTIKQTIGTNFDYDTMMNRK